MRKDSLWILKLGGDEWTAVFMAASGLIWTVAAYRSIPDVALGLGQYGGKGFSGSSWPVPADHGMPVWAVGFCWMSIGFSGIATMASRRLHDFQRTHAVVFTFLAVLFFVLVAWLTWI